MYIHHPIRVSLTSRVFDEMQSDDGKKAAPSGDAKQTEIQKLSLWGDGLFYDFRHRFLG
jgi:hypothetical protein